MEKNTNIQWHEQLSDEELVALFQERGKKTAAAYAELVCRHHLDLSRRCHARLGNAADAEEAVQETLLRAFHGLLQYRREACFRTWLFSIGDNQCNTLLVRRSRHVLTDHMRALIELNDELRYNDESVEDVELVKVVREILAELPCQAGDVLMLRFYRDLSVEDIASTLGIGLSAAKMRLYRAIAQFESRFPAKLWELAA